MPWEPGWDWAPRSVDRPITFQVGGVMLTEEVSRDEDQRSFRVEVAPESPFLKGHFPGSPLLPAAAILTFVAEVSRMFHTDRPLVGFEAVRFSAPVAPGCSARLTLREQAGDLETLFELATDDEILASGRVLYGDSSR